MSVMTPQLLLEMINVHAKWKSDFQDAIKNNPTKLNLNLIRNNFNSGDRLSEWIYSDEMDEQIKSIEDLKLAHTEFHECAFYYATNVRQVAEGLLDDHDEDLFHKYQESSNKLKKIITTISKELK